MWTVERVVCGDGTADKSGVQLLEGRIYGCASRWGGNESFHAILLHSLKLFETSIELPDIDGQQKGFLHPKDGILKDNLMAWCQNHPGHVVDIGGPGQRERIEGERMYQCRDYGPILMVSNYGTCAIAALVNGVDALLGRDAAQEALETWEKSRPRVKTLKNVAILLHALKRNLNVQKICQKQLQGLEKDLLEWLAQQTSGVFIVRVVQQGIVDHVVVVDGNRRLVLDSASRYPFVLTVELLRKVGGFNATKLEVAEVRKLVQYPFNPRKRKRVKE